MLFVDAQGLRPSRAQQENWGFRGINGRRPALRVPSIYSTFQIFPVALATAGLADGQGFMRGVCAELGD
jgi:hypothetical protein